MSKRKFVGVMVVALAVIVMAGGLLASNMGFKLNYTLQAPAVGVSNTGQNTLALPDNRQTGMVNASNLLTDIGGTTAVANVTKFLKATDTYQIYTGIKGSQPDFALAAGEGYLVKMKTTVNYIVVGSDDPTAAYALNAPQAGVSNTGQNLYAYNYHQTAAMASALLNEIGGTTVVANVTKYLKATDTYQIYTGIKGSQPDFALTPGEAYFIKMKSTVNYTPSHY